MNLEFIQALKDIEQDKGISMDTLVEAIESALISAYRRNFGSAENVDVRIDRDSGEIQVVAEKTVTTEVEDDASELSLERAKTISPVLEEGDTVEIEVTPEKFGRIAAQTAKQVVMQRIREAERDIIYDEFVTREGDVITGIVRRVQGRKVFIDLGRTEAILSPSEQIPGEYYRQNERIKCYIVEVKKTTKGPQIVLSRSHPGLLKRLFELEVPEIHDGLVEIRGIAREAGSRSKLAVYSSDENVDAVGACVGPRGARVQAVVRELKGEKIDVVRWAEDPADYVKNALSPARVTQVMTTETDEAKLAEVVVPDDQLSLAIGKEGQNARLAAKLTGWKIDISSETQAAEREAEAQAQEAAELDEEDEAAVEESAPPTGSSAADDEGDRAEETEESAKPAEPSPASAEQEEQD
jgi:N utilization substance protein A